MDAAGKAGTRGSGLWMGKNVMLRVGMAGWRRKKE